MSGPRPASPPVQPMPTPDTTGFWEATARDELALCWCGRCRRYLHPPLEACPDCAGRTEFKPVSGRGRIHSFIVVHRTVAPGYEDRPGHVIVLVDLEEQDGLRLVAQLEGVVAAGVEIGAAVEAELVGLPGGDYRVPVFRLLPA